MNRYEYRWISWLPTQTRTQVSECNGYVCGSWKLRSSTPLDRTMLLLRHQPHRNREAACKDRGEKDLKRQSLMPSIPETHHKIHLRTEIIPSHHILAALHVESPKSFPLIVGKYITEPQLVAKSSFLRQVFVPWYSEWSLMPSSWGSVMGLVRYSLQLASLKAMRLCARWMPSPQFIPR